MLKTVYKIITGLLIALGVVHVLYTAREYEGLSLDALWFVSAGVAVILVGLINVILLRCAGEDPVVRWIGFGSIFTITMLFAVALLVLREPQVFIGLFLSGFEAAASLLLRRG